MPDKPFAYGLDRATLRVIVRSASGAVRGGSVRYNDRYAWEGRSYAPLREEAPLWLYARDGQLEYWAADLRLHPPRLRYRFGLAGDDEGDSQWYGWDGLRDVPEPTQAFEFAYIAEGDLPDSPEWARGATFYHVFPDRFARSAAAHRRAPVEPWDGPVGRRSFLGGDLDGIVERLDHIESLSVDALYVTPIFSSPSNHKYDTRDYFSVDPDFGGNDALRRLVHALHARGMRLVLDGVFNHAGAEWPPFLDVRQKGRRSAFADWFYLADNGAAGPGYETWAMNVPSLPKLRTSEPDVRDLVCRIGRFWVQEYGTDGWRLDVANEVDHRLWREFRTAVRRVRPDAFLVGEVWTLAMPWLRGDQFDSVMNYPFRDAILGFAGRGRVDGAGFLDAVDRVRAAYPEPVHGFLYNLLGSHDGERPLTACAGDKTAFAVASGLLFTLPGSVSIYYGDEVGMEGGKDPDCRRGMVWQPDRQDARLLDLYRQLGRLRRDVAALRTGRYVRLAEAGCIAVFGRELGAERIVVAANAGEKEERIALTSATDWLRGPAAARQTLAYTPGSASVAAGHVRVPPHSVTLFETPGRARAKQDET